MPDVFATPTPLPTIAGGILNPNSIMREIQNFTIKNGMILTLLCILILGIAAYLGYLLYKDYAAIPKSKRRFFKGRTSVAKQFREELLKRMKKKRG